MRVCSILPARRRQRQWTSSLSPQREALRRSFSWRRQRAMAGSPGNQAFPQISVAGMQTPATAAWRITIKHFQAFLSCCKAAIPAIHIFRQNPLSNVVKRKNRSLCLLMSMSTCSPMKRYCSTASSEPSAKPKKPWRHHH